LVKENELKHSMSAGIIEIESAYLCLKPIANEISFFIEGAGNSVKVTVPEKQRLC